MPLYWKEKELFLDKKLLVGVVNGKMETIFEGVERFRKFLASLAGVKE